MRSLWEQHVAWMRMAIVSFAADLPDLKETTARLLRNQSHIGDAIKPYTLSSGIVKRFPARFR